MPYDRRGKPEDVPDDVWAKAGVTLGSSLMHRVLVRVRIARAIMADRERWLAIAMGKHPTGDDTEFWQGYASAMAVVAAAIRSTGKP